MDSISTHITISYNLLCNLKKENVDLKTKKTSLIRLLKSKFFVSKLQKLFDIVM